MQSENSSIPEFLSGGGETGKMMRSMNWSETPLGDPATWPQSLRTCLHITLTSSQPMFVWWGKELINIYNDAYIEILGGKHPWAFARPASEVWREIWNELLPRVETVMTRNVGTYDEALLLILERNGYPEETYYTFSYSPIPGDDGEVGGILCANTNNTDLIINERSIETLRELATLSYERTVESVYKNAAEVLFKNNKDFPFAIFYKVEEENNTATAVAWAGDASDYSGFPLSASLKDPVEGTKNLARAIATNQVTLVKNEGRRLNIPKGFWDVIPTEFLHIPISHPNRNRPLAVLTIGLNPYRQFNAAYKNFIKLVADQISLVVNNVLASEEERKRTQALEEIDRAKTHFFSNISHEFRTPLTLILGPLESILNNPADDNFSFHADSIKSAHRNTLRLLRLVNMLLEFSRIEAGRVEALYQVVNATQFTADLASAFRSMIEMAGLKFNVSLEEMSQPVYLDRDMWEKIVLNLISNAFKYTLSGEISITLQEEEHDMVLRVSDTGIGIPEKELPHMFERFHRIQNSQGRSFEGTGIGLSLVYELVKLHSGKISVQSKEGEGSIFTVRIPFGKDHLPPQQIVLGKSDYMSTALINSFINESASADHPVKKIGGRSQDTQDKSRIKILVVDDNADMRDYIQSLLENEYEVETAVNGSDALEKIGKNRPYLIISDIMMPVVDGNELLKTLKQSSATAGIPVIFLSARAGDEARSEGLEAGADDYLVKPFSAKEIVSRVKAQIKLAQTRAHLLAQVYNLFEQAPVAICVFRGKSMVIETANEKMLELWGKTAEVMNKPVMEALPEIEGQGFEILLDNVFTSGERFVSHESPALLVRNGVPEHIFVKFVFEPLYDEDGTVSGVMAIADEVTYQVTSKKIIEASEKRYRQLIESLPIGIYTCDMEGYVTLFNKAFVEMCGRKPELNKDKWFDFWEIFKADGLSPLAPEFAPMGQVLRNEPITEKEIILKRTGAEPYFVQPYPIPMYDEEGNMNGAINMLMNISDQKKAQKKSDENQLLFRTISNTAPVGLWMTDAAGKCNFVNDTWASWTGLDFMETMQGDWFKSILPEDRLIVRENFLEALKTRSYFKGEFRLNRADGELRWCLTEGYPFNSNDGSFLGYSGSVTDITDRKIAQEELEKTIEKRTKSLRQRNKELKDSEERYHNMISEVQDYAIILLDKNGTILNWNAGAQKIKGYSEPEIIGKNFRIFYLPEDIETYLPEKLISTAIETGRAENEGWRIRKDGTKFWTSSVITALHDHKNNIIGFSKVTRDLTERKKAEDIMSKYVMELKRQNTELEQFAYVSSHDLQEPLRKIRTFSELLESMLQDPVHRNYLAKINSSAERMSNLIKDLLNYSRLSKEKEEFVSVDLNVVFENVKTDLEVVIAQKNAIIEHDVLPVIKGIPLQFNQLFLNLLTNSLKFNTAQPVIKVKVQPARVYETVAARLDPQWSYAKLVFSDNGIGFEPHYAEQIFTIFQRLNTRQKFSGTGIGLAMCKKIVDNHGGYIEAKGEPDKGSTFTIYLPLR